MHYHYLFPGATSEISACEGAGCRALKGPPPPVLPLGGHLVALQFVLRLHSNYLEWVTIQQVTLKSLVMENSKSRIVVFLRQIQTLAG